jgi:hypothetical protein
MRGGVSRVTHGRIFMRKSPDFIYYPFNPASSNCHCDEGLPQASRRLSAGAPIVTQWRAALRRKALAHQRLRARVLIDRRPPREEMRSRSFLSICQEEAARRRTASRTAHGCAAICDLVEQACRDPPPGLYGERGRRLSNCRTILTAEKIRHYHRIYGTKTRSLKKNRGLPR